MPRVKGELQGRCDSGDHFHCIVTAEELANASKHVEAKALGVKACDAKVMTACPLVGAIDKAAAKYAAEIDGLWKDVEQPGESIAENRYMIGCVKTKRRSCRRPPRT